MEKYVYFFHHKEKSSNDYLQKINILGNKGARLADMTTIGIPVPPGFILSTEVCRYYFNNEQQFAPGLWDEISNNIEKLEKAMGQKFGDPVNPLIVSVRSGAAVSMPGMMETILNIGFSRPVVEEMERKGDDIWFAWDCYRRLIQMYTSTVKGVDENIFNNILKEVKEQRGVATEKELSVDDLKLIVEKFENAYRKECESDFPQNAKEQLYEAVEAVVRSWNTPRAVKYREMKNIAEEFWGTAVIVQAMVFGNKGNNSATGVAFSRNISTGEKKIYGEYLNNAQGEDVVSGVVTPKNIIELKEDMPQVFMELENVLRKLERRYSDVQDVEFTVQEGKLFILQTRTAKRTPIAAVKIAVDMVEEGLITKEEALSRVSEDQLEQLLYKKLDLTVERNVIASGLSVSPGVAVGRVVFTSDDAVKLARKGEKVIFVRQYTSPSDIAGMKAAEGVLTAKGGAASHAAIVCRDLGKVAIVGCSEISVDYKKEQFSTSECTVKRGDWITLDGDKGQVILGKAVINTVAEDKSLMKLLNWASEFPELKQKFEKINQKLASSGGL